MVKQTVGIVLKEINTSNENDKIVVALTKEHGKKSFYFKNAKKKNYAATSLFSLSEFNFTSGKNFFNAKEVSLIESFYNIRSDVKKFAYASYMIEFISEFALEDVASDEILKFLYYTLNLLNKSFLNLELIKVVFEMKILQYAGMSIREIEAVQFATGQENMETQKEK